MTCPEPTTIADLLEGRLSAADVASIEEHLDTCSRCAELVAAAASTHASATTGLPGDGATIVPGTQVGRYAIRRWIGRGGMGDVYEGFDPALERRVAIKLVRESGDDRLAAQRRLAREAKALARLSSANVVAALDVVLFDDRLFLIMELVEGPTLAEWLRVRPRPWREILGAFLDAGDGLAAAHDVGVIHRDFKPQNVLLGGDGKARVSDFGLARAVARAMARTVEGSAMGAVEGASAPADGRSGHHEPPPVDTTPVVGTPRYMAPEQFLGQPVHPQSDQFSFCVSLYEALYGCHPFASERQLRAPNAADALNRAVVVGPPAAPPRTAGAARGLASVLKRGLARNAADRFPSMRDLLAALRSAARRRQRRWLATALPLLLLAVGSSVWVLTRSRDPLVLLEPVGEPADWSSSRILFRSSERVHCVIPLGADTLRVVSGKVRQAVDIDVHTGVQRPTDLAPESYRDGCPILSPDGSQLIFEGYDAKGRPHIFHASNPQGSRAEPVVAAIPPQHGSTPMWLASGRDFVFDLDQLNAAVFSLQTNMTTVIPNREPSQNLEWGFLKTVSRTADRIAVEHMRKGGRGLALRIYQWPTLALRAEFSVSMLAGLTWRFGADPDHLYGRISERGDDILIVFDEARRLLSTVARVPGRDIVDYLEPAPPGRGVVVTRRLSAAVWLNDGAGDRQILYEPSGGFSHPSFTTEGQLLLVRSTPTTSKVFLYRPEDGSGRDLSGDNEDYAVTPLPGDEWIVARKNPSAGVFRCSGSSTSSDIQCRPILTDQVWQIAASPTGKHLAYLVPDAQGVHLRAMALDGTWAIGPRRDVATCPPVWSSATTFWVSLVKGTGVEWTELHVATLEPTGRSLAGKVSCSDYFWPNDFDPPVPSPVRIVTEEDWDIRLRP